MLVSFVIPTRNQAPFIRKCIDRCLAQDIPEAEVIVVDGLSTDGTQDILASYEGRIRWISEADAGQADAVNKGVRMARGELIAWINSDDYYPNGTILPQVEQAFVSDPQLDIVYGDGLMVDSRGDVIRKHRGRCLRSPAQMVTHPASFVMQPAVFFRKALFEAVGGVSVELHWALDYELWLRMFPRARKARYLPAVLACATYHPGAKSVRAMRVQIGEACRIKRHYSHEMALGLWDRLRMRCGMLSLHLYAWAVAFRLRRHV
jgi:glycosyltransferase involved in cell wall biosynthesis